jgi:hypothetical protein
VTDRVYSSQWHAEPGAEAWRVLPEGAYALFRTDSFATSVRFIDAISHLVPERNGLNIDDRSTIMPFWQAVLGYQPRPDSSDEDLVDPHDRLAPFWFEEMDELRADGAGTVHLVVWVPWDEAEDRMQAGLAAGGRLVRHNADEGFSTLADPAGNEVDIATTSAPEATG